MSKFVVIIFPAKTMIHEGIDAIKKLHAKGGIKLYASTAIERDSNGKLSVQEITKEGLGGTAVGALIGGLAGLPLGPVGTTIGAAGGAILGVSADLLEEGDEAKFAREISGELTRGKAAIVAEVDENSLTVFEALMKAIGGTVICSSR
jgi:uncharacterized membrane protein